MRSWTVVLGRFIRSTLYGFSSDMRKKPPLYLIIFDVKQYTRVACTPCLVGTHIKDDWRVSLVPHWQPIFNASTFYLACPNTRFGLCIFERRRYDIFRFWHKTILKKLPNRSALSAQIFYFYYWIFLKRLICTRTWLRLLTVTRLRKRLNIPV